MTMVAPSNNTSYKKVRKMYLGIFFYKLYNEILASESYFIISLIRGQNIWETSNKKIIISKFAFNNAIRRP